MFWYNDLYIFSYETTLKINRILTAELKTFGTKFPNNIARLMTGDIEEHNLHIYNIKTVLHYVKIKEYILKYE